MKEIRQKKDKGVSAIIATILLIAITVVLAATLVTILGGFTHGVSNSVVTVGATTQESNSSSTHYVVYFNVTSSSSSIGTGHFSALINGASVGTFSTFLNKSAPSGYKNPTTLSGGSSFEFTYTSAVTSFELVYDGSTIYQSGSITIS